MTLPVRLSTDVRTVTEVAYALHLTRHIRAIAHPSSVIWVRVII